MSQPYTHRYAWKNNAVRAALYGRLCRVTAAGKLGTVRLEFEDGTQVITSRRAIKRLQPAAGARWRNALELLAPVVVEEGRS